MDCVVKYLGGSGDVLSLVLKGKVYKFESKSEKTLDVSLGELISRLPDKSLRSKFQVNFAEDPGPTLNIEQRNKPTVPIKKKTYVPKKTKQRSLV